MKILSEEFQSGMNDLWPMVYLRDMFRKFILWLSNIFSAAALAK